MNVLMEESESPNKVIDLASRCQSSATKKFFGTKALQLEEKLMIMSMMFWLKLLLDKVGFKNTFLPLVQNNIHDSLVMLMEQDIPTNYEETMVDLSMRND